MASRGHRVAIATSTGTDPLGDQIDRWIRRNLAHRAEIDGFGDLITYFWERDSQTRLTTAITFGGTRITFDNDTDRRSGVLPKLKGLYRNESPSIQALYLGTYFVDPEEMLLGRFSDTKWRFFETGAQGPKDAQSFDRVVCLARRCTHVLSSAQFVLLLTGDEPLGKDLTESSCQQQVHANAVDISSRAYRRLWPSTDSGGHLVIVMGEYGAIITSRSPGGTLSSTPVEIVKVPENAGRNWLGCGDMFRAEFIHQVMSGASEYDASGEASRAVADKIKRMRFHEWST